MKNTVFQLLHEVKNIHRSKLRCFILGEVKNLQYSLVLHMESLYKKECQLEFLYCN